MKLATAENLQNPDTRAEAPVVTRELRWGLAFVGILGYLLVEYERLPDHYAFLRPFELGKVVAGMSLLGLLLAPRIKREDRSIHQLTDLTLFVFLFVSFLSACFAPYQDQAWLGMLDSVGRVAVTFLISRIVVSRWRHRIFIFLFLLINLKMAQSAIRYYYASKAYWGEEIAVREGARAGSTAFFSNSADFGVAMCVVWPIAMMLLFSKPRNLWRIFLPACGAVFLFAIMVCGSRGAVVGAAAILLAAWAKSPKKLGAVILLVLFLPGIYFVMPSASKARFESAVNWRDDPTAMSRIIFWKAGLRMLRNHPLLGVGPRNFSPVRLHEYLDSEGPAKAYVPHSIYIQALSELGILGTGPMVVLWVLVFRLNSKTRKRLLAEDPGNRRSFEYCLASGLDLGMVGYLTSGVFVAVLYYPHHWVILGLSLGLHAACSAKSTQTVSEMVTSQNQPLEKVPA